MLKGYMVKENLGTPIIQERQPDLNTDGSSIPLLLFNT